MATYFIADTHFFHKDIISICGRPFADCGEMHKHLKKRWNETVHNDDEVYIVGDFATTSLESIKSILSLLNGRKYLVMGNHDTYTLKEYYDAGFDKVYDRPVIVDDFWIVSHEPMFINDTMPYVNIFGHVHNSPLYRDYSKKHFCVCVERIGYAPISFETIKDIIKKEHEL